MNLQELSQKLANLKKLDYGEAYTVFAIYLTLYSDICGKLHIELHKIDDPDLTPLEKIVRIVGIDRTEKIYDFDNEQQLTELLENLEAEIL